MRSWLLLCPLLILLAIGCKGKQSQTSSSPGSTSSQSSTTTPASDESETKASVLSIAPDASPKGIAKIALLAIAANDKATLQSLVAVKKVTQDIREITRGRAAFQGMVNKAIPTAASAIMIEINGLDAGGREIDQETITGDTALVTVIGERAGQKQTKRFFLVREDNQWRLVPSHR